MLRRWWSKIRPFPSRAKNPSGKACFRIFRPWLEFLEDRLTPSQITNGGFESPALRSDSSELLTGSAFPGWKITGTVQAENGLVLPAQGYQFLNLLQGNVSQKITSLQANSIYSVSFYYSYSGSGNAAFDLSNGYNDYSYSLPASTDPGGKWIPFSFKFSPDNTTSTGSSATLTFTGNSPSTSRFLLDAVSLTQVNPIAVTSGSGQTAPITAQFANQLVVTVRDAGGNPVPGATVTFSGPKSGATALFTGGNTAVTDSSGQAVKTITANTLAGTYNITATVAGASTPAVFSLTNEAGPSSPISFPASVIFLGQPPSLNYQGNGFSSPVEVKVTDLFGNAFPDAKVTLSISGNGVLLGTTTLTTDSNGLALFSDLSVPTIGRSYTLTATVTYGFTEVVGNSSVFSVLNRRVR